VTRIKQKNICEECDCVVEYADLVRVTETPDGRLVPFTKDEVTEIKANSMISTAKKAVITPVTDASEWLFPTGNSYYCYPEPGASMQAYSAIVSLVQRHPEWEFVTVFTVKTGSEHLGRFVVLEGVLALETCAWPESARSATPVDLQFDPRADAMMDRLALDIVKSFDPSEYRNQFTEAVATAIADYNGQLPEAPKPKKMAVKADDFLDQLSAVVDKRTKRQKKGTRTK
jgi:non-homologous end joining protein Ku